MSALGIGRHHVSGVRPITSAPSIRNTPPLDRVNRELIASLIDQARHAPITDDAADHAIAILLNN
jgi:hypothetical protein